MINITRMAAERKKNRRKVEEVEGKPTKEEYAVAKFLRFNVPTREGKFHNMEVQCFFASAAVDALMESKWSASKNPKEPLFFNRNSCVSFCHRLLQKGLFHRAEKVQRKKDKDKGDKSKKKKGKDTSEKEEAGTGDELRERKSKKKGKKEKEESAVEKASAAEGKEKETEEKKEEKKDEGKKKKEKRLKLVMTDDQRFIDGEDNIYVWIYDPVHAKTLVIGSLIVLGAIALCLFPLWPEEVRIGVYYLSLVAAGFVGFILSLVVLRLILFCAIWLLTFGRHHFWLLPNLTEDVGFFESFRPLYKHDRVTKDSSASKDKSSKSSKKSELKESKGKSKEKDKSSDREESGSEDQEEFEMIDRGDVEGEGGRDEEEEDPEEEGADEEEGEGNEEQEEGSEGGGDVGYEDEEDENGMEDEEEEEYDEEDDQNGVDEDENGDDNDEEEESQSEKAKKDK